MSIKIDAEYWPIAAGCIGLAKLFNENELPRTSTGIILQESILDNLAEKYIKALIEMFNVVKRDVKRYGWYAKQAEKEPTKTKQLAKDLRNLMNDQYKKVFKYFPNTNECNRLHLLLEKLKTVNKPEHYSMIKEVIDQYNEIISTPFINDKLSLNLAKSEALIPFFGQTSILQKTFYSKSIEEHILQIEKDFIIPAKLEYRFFQLRNRDYSIEEQLNFLKEHQEYKPFRILLQSLKNLSSEKVEQYLKKQVLYCSFIDGLIATQSYEEMIFSPLSFSKSKAVNFNWDFDNDLPVPMSALARLIMFVAPYGMAFYPRRIGDDQANEYLTFSGLILNQKDFSEIIRENITYQKLRREGSSFGEAIVGLLQETLHKAKKLKDNNSYLIIELYSNYDRKKTLLDYYHMPSYLANYLKLYGNSLNLLFHRDLRDNFLRSILKGVDPKKILFQYLRFAIKEPFHAQGAYFATRERKRILQGKKIGVEAMSNYDNVIYFVYCRGVELRNKTIKSRMSSIQENEPYRASGQKKLEGIAYRLLNAAKAGNKNAFMDTIFRIHMAAGLPVPNIFIDIFKDKGLDFESISSAFIAGLLSNEKIEKGGEKDRE